MLGDYWDRRPERVKPPPLVDGHDLLREFGLEPGPQIGELLEAVREAQVAGEVGDRNEALSLIGIRLGGEDGIHRRTPESDAGRGVTTNGADQAND
jgi:hypothetical protein